MQGGGSRCMRGRVAATRAGRAGRGASPLLRRPGRDRLGALGRRGGAARNRRGPRSRMRHCAGRLGRPRASSGHCGRVLPRGGRGSAAVRPSGACRGGGRGLPAPCVGRARAGAGPSSPRGGMAAPPSACRPVPSHARAPTGDLGPERDRSAPGPPRPGPPSAGARGGRSADSRARGDGSTRMGRARHPSQPASRILGDEGSGADRVLRRLPRSVRGGQAIPKQAKTTELDQTKRAKRAASKDGSNGKRNAKSKASDRAAKVKVRRPARRRAVKADGTPADREGHTRVGAETITSKAPELESTVTANLTTEERGLLGDLLAVIAEHSDESLRPIDTTAVESAFAFACERHADQRRKSGEDFITHPVEVAKICAGLRLDTETLCAALLHDTVEDTSASLEEVREHFGEQIAALVDGVTKLTGITFQSRDEHQAENYRKMMVAMATDVRVILIKLADRLHNMRTLDALPKQKQIEKARETLEIYAPLAHRLGIHAIKWELEDLAFARLHPRKYDEIKKLVSQQRAERERYVEEAGAFLRSELAKVGIEAEISGRAKHFYSIYSKMTKKGREFNEIYDLTAMRVIVGSVKDCYGAIGIIHSLWKPLPGRFKDFVATPKLNLYSALHTTVIGPEGRPLEIQIRTPEMHETAEYGIAAHVIYKEGAGRKGDPEREKMTWLRQLLDVEGEQDPVEFLESLKIDLFEDEVFVFTPKGEVKNLSAGSTPLDFAYAVHTDVGHRCVGSKVNGKIVPLHYQLKSGDIVEILTAKQERGPSRDWLALVRTSRARNKIRAFLKRERREDAERLGREALQSSLRKGGLPPQRIAGSPLLADLTREMGFRKADDFYIALGQGKISAKTVVNKVMQRLKSGEAVAGDETE